MQDDPASYIIQYKLNYFSGINPAGENARETEGYQKLVRFAKSYFDTNKYDDFAAFLQEGQYFINLWTAHLILQYGQPNETLKQMCLKIIRQYTDNPLAPDVAIEEKIWLDNYLKSEPI